MQNVPVVSDDDPSRVPGHTTAAARMTAAAVAAAWNVATRLGLGPTRPRVIAVGSVQVIALDPLPIVARISHVVEDRVGIIPPTLQIELAAHVAARGGPVVSPLSTGAGPHVTGQFAVTLWERVPDHPVTPHAVGRALHRWHEVIVDFPGALPSFDPRPVVRRIAAQLPGSAHEVAIVLRTACDAIQVPDLPAQTLHGDSHIGNALGGTTGPLWNDLEYACVGPIEWDLAAAAHQAAVLGRRLNETDALLTGYGPDAAERAALLVDAFALRMAAETASAAAARPDLKSLAERRLEWLRHRIG